MDQPSAKAMIEKMPPRVPPMTLEQRKAQKRLDFIQEMEWKLGSRVFSIKNPAAGKLFPVDHRWEISNIDEKTGMVWIKPLNWRKPGEQPIESPEEELREALFARGLEVDPMDLEQYMPYKKPGSD